VSGAGSQIRDTIEKHGLLSPGDAVVLGLSGGPDSLCLLDVLCGISEQEDLDICAVHLNHLFRPGAAEEDMRFCEQECDRRGVPIRTFTVDCARMAREEGITPEEAGRKARYEAFARVAREWKEAGKKQVKIAVAQNRNDQAETVLFRIMRGTGVDGLAGIEYSRTDEYGNQVIRPLLDTDREEILAYCRGKGLAPRTDATNMEPVYSRNRIRLELLPYMKENFNGNIVGALARLAENAAEDKAYLVQETERAFAGARLDGAGVTLAREKLLQLPPALLHRVIVKAFSDAGLQQDIGRVHLEQADSLISGDRASGSVDFPHGYTLCVSYDRVSCGGPRPAAAQPEAKPELMARVVTLEEYRTLDLEKNTFAAFDADMLTAGGVRLRTRRQGDRLALPSGHKSLRRLMVDLKVPRQLRDEVLVAAMGSEVLWIPPQQAMKGQRPRYSSDYKVTDGTKRVMILEMEYEV
jgi:tRNA(Ile)-lysidine synthase